MDMLQRGVSHLDLSFDFGLEYRLPREILVCRTLVKLYVNHGFYFNWQALGKSLPMLKDLFITRVGFWLDQYEMLLHACPALETLLMSGIQWLNSNVTVSSASLKRLYILSNRCSENPKSISFDTPSVVRFVYRDFVVEDYPIVNLTNLVKATIDLKLTEDQIERARAPNIDLLEDDVFLRFGNVWKLISGIRNVHELYLCSDTLEVLSLCCESMLVFNNLKVLRIKSQTDREWQAMPVLLRNCPHLETLVLEGLLHHVTDKCGDACKCISQEFKGCSLISCLVKKLQIKEFRGTIKEILMIQHFLLYFPCLKKMEIYRAENDPTIVEVPESLELMMKLYFVMSSSWIRSGLLNSDEFP